MKATTSLEATGVHTPLLDIRFAPQAQAPDMPSASTTSIQCALPAVVQVEPFTHRVLVELHCAVYSVDEPTVVLVAPDPAIAVQFVQPEEDPFEELYQGTSPLWEPSITQGTRSFTRISQSESDGEGCPLF